MHLLYNMCLIFTDGFTSCGKSAALTVTPGQTLCVLLKHNTLMPYMALYFSRYPDSQVRTQETRLAESDD